MNEDKKMFGRQYVPVKNYVILAYFKYDEQGKVFYTMKVVGKRVNNRLPVSPKNVELFDERGAFYLHSDAPLMTVDGKQRTLPKSMLTYALADDPKEFKDALEKLAGVLRHSGPFTAVCREFI